jgi:thiamine biosynthesis protein ThiI
MFEKQLIRQIKKSVEPCGDFYIYREFGRFFLVGADTDVEDIIPKVTSVLGIISVCLCYKSEDMSILNIKDMALELVKQEINMSFITRFKIKTIRSNKKYPITSQDVSTEVGAYLLSHFNNLIVDLKKPDLTLNIEIREQLYIYTKEYKGYGGLPIGLSGSSLSLLSGGIDSPVATFLMAKRGIIVDTVYFHSPPFVSEKTKLKVLDIAKRLAMFTGGINLYVINFTDIQTYLYDNVQLEKLTILLKRAMLKTADVLADKYDYLSLITGDAVGQVASQTMHSLVAVESASKRPIIRPLAGFDKVDIVNIANMIETFEISNRPYEDCCTLFVAKNPETKPRANVIENIEKKLDILEEKIFKAVENVDIISF